MGATAILFVMAVSVLLSGAVTPVRAQQPQIPTLQVCNPTRVAGGATVLIQSRKDAAHTGKFRIEIELKCDPGGDGYPAGGFSLNVDMSDSIITGTIDGTSLEQVTTTGKHTPTAYLNGRCKADNVRGCRFWLMLADNKQANAQGTPDVVGFLIFDGKGNRVAYGTGPVVDGDIKVVATGF